MNELSRENLFNGELVCYQHRKGYRYSVDAVLLAHFVKVQAGDRILELGAGCGIITLLLCYRHQKYIGKLLGIELQRELADLAARNLRENGFEQKARIVQGDIRDINTLIAAETFDKIVCNPPFFTPGKGRKNLAKQARIARHQVEGGLDDFLCASRLAVKNHGCVCFIYPAEQICEFIQCAASQRLAPKRVQFIYSYPKTSARARLALVQCVKNGGPGTEILAPFYIYQEQYGNYSAAMENLYSSNSGYCHISGR